MEKQVDFSSFDELNPLMARSCKGQSQCWGGKTFLGLAAGSNKGWEVEMEEELDRRRQKDVNPFFVSKPFLD